MNWKKVKIGSFLKERVGRYKPAEANATGLKRVEKIDFSGKYHLVNKHTNTDMILVKKGDLLISGINAEKGAVTIFNHEKDALATIHYSSYEFDKSKINIDYFKWFLISDAFKNLLKASAGGGIKTELKAKHLLPLEINLPHLDEQAFIVESIKARHHRLTILSNELDQQQTYLQLLRQTILQEAVQGKLTKQNSTEEPAAALLKRIKAEKEKLIKASKLNRDNQPQPILEYEIPFGLPEGWSWCRLEEISYVGNGSTPSKTEFTESPSDVPYLKVYNIVKQKVNFEYKPQYIKRSCHEGQLKRSISYSGDVLMNIVGPPLGKIAIIPEEIPECNINQAIVVIRPFIKELNQWIYWFLCEKTAVNAIVTKGTAGQDNISVTQSRNIVVPLPPLAEQQRIVAKVQQLQQHLSELEGQVQQSRQYAQQLLQSVLKEAFEGNEVKEFANNELLTLAAEE
jgi:type I restriction enzyme, S subunit